MYRAIRRHRIAYTSDAYAATFDIYNSSDVKEAAAKVIVSEAGNAGNPSQGRDMNGNIIGCPKATTTSRKPVYLTPRAPSSPPITFL